MSARLSIFLILCAWAAIYLPGLGEPELRGEEPRRILPALGMLETGDWIVPRIAGEIYANKPPLINWAVAGAFALTGSTSEGTARLVSAGSILLLALGAFLLLRRDRGDHALLVALALLTTFNLIAKGRIIEIEAPLTALFGLACFLWIRLWTDRRSPWLVWSLPYLLLGLACLLKGPVHLLFWFPLVAAATRFAGEGRSLFHPAHALGLVLMGAVFLPWVYLNIREVGAGENSVGNWVAELTQRGDVSNFSWSRWLTTPLRIVGGFLPWALPLAFTLWILRRDRFSLRRGRRDDAVLYGCLVSMALGFVVVCLLPQGTPRYLLPVYPLAALATVALYFRLPDAARQRYEIVARKSLVWLVLVLGLAPAIAATIAASRGVSPPLASLALSAALVALVAYAISGPWRTRGLILHSSLLLSAAFAGLLPAMQGFYSDRDLFRQAAVEVAALAPGDGRIVLYADRETHLRRTRLLRLIYYVRKPVEGIGESGALPADTVMVFGRAEAEEAIREKIGGRAILARDTAEIRTMPIVWFALEPPQT